MSRKIGFSLGTVRVVAAAIESIGSGYDLCCRHLSLRNCKSPRLIAIDDDQVHNVEFPYASGFTINVPNSIKCIPDKGDPVFLCSDVLSYKQMSEQFNQELSLSVEFPTGYFDAAFAFSGVWHEDAADTKSLAFKGISRTLYNVEFDKTQLILLDDVKQAVPSSWDPASLARFIQKYGTHIIVGLKIGASDIIYAKQMYQSLLQPADVQKRLNYIADAVMYRSPLQPTDVQEKLNDIADKVFDPPLQSASGGWTEEMIDIKFIRKTKGVGNQPVVISMSFIPIASLLSRTSGSGYLTHAINAYLWYKPPIKELHRFLEFQIPRRWAPVFGGFAFSPERKPENTASSLISFMGPKLYVNTTPVGVGKKLVTGLRLYLEGKSSNCLAIHLQHLSSLPKTFQLQDELNQDLYYATYASMYYEKVQLRGLSYVCTAPIESDADNSVVTGAHLEVGESGGKKVLYLRLRFSTVAGAMLVKSPEWDGSAGWNQKSGIISTWIGTHLSSPQKPPPQPSDAINSASVSTQTPKFFKFVDTTEIVRGPQHKPGYWVVSGARLSVENGKISLRAKYSLLHVKSVSDEEAGSSYLTDEEPASYDPSDVEAEHSYQSTRCYPSDEEAECSYQSTRYYPSDEEAECSYLSDEEVMGR